MAKTVKHLNRYLDSFHPLSTRKNEDLLFYTVIHERRNQMSPDSVAAFMKKYGRQAQATCDEMPRNVHPHQLRHTRAIGLYRNGVPLILVSEILGHADINTTQVYYGKKAIMESKTRGIPVLLN
jgi:site-specific recombinase XerD